MADPNTIVPTGDSAVGAIAANAASYAGAISTTDDVTEVVIGTEYYLATLDGGYFMTASGYLSLRI